MSVLLVLDRAALSELGGFGQLETGDLQQVGWLVEAPEPTGDGGASIRIAKQFPPGGLQQVMTEVGGSDGIFRDWSVGVLDGFAETTYQVNGNVVLSGSLDQFSDPAVAQALDGLPFGRTPAEMSALITSPSDLTLTVEVHAGSSEPFAETFYPAGGESINRVVSVTSRTVDEGTVRILIFGAVCLVAAGIVAFIGRNRSR